MPRKDPDATVFDDKICDFQALTKCVSAQVLEVRIPTTLEQYIINDRIDNQRIKLFG